MPLPKPLPKEAERRVPLCGSVAAAIVGVDSGASPEELEKAAGPKVQRAVSAACLPLLLGCAPWWYLGRARP